MTAVLPDTIRAQRSPVVAYFVGFVFVGMSLSFAGPALSHIRDRAGVGIGVSGLVFGSLSLGYIVASLIAGRHVDRGHGHRWWIVAAVAAGAATCALVVVETWWVIVVLFAALGAAGGVMEVAGNTLVVWSRPPEQVASALNGLHLCFGIGALSTPLLVSRSIVWAGDLRWFALVLAVLAAVVCRLLFTSTAPTLRLPAVVTAGTTSVRRGALALLCVFFFVYVGVEVGVAGWTSTFAEEIDLGGDGVGGVLTSVFWAGFTLGRLGAIWLARRLGAITILIGSVVGVIASGVVLALSDGRAIGVWLCTALVGFTIGPLFPTMLAYGDERLGLSGASTSLIIAASGLGGLTLPVAIGWILDRQGAQALPWTATTGFVVIGVVIAVIIVAARQRPPATSTNAPVT